MMTRVLLLLTTLACQSAASAGQRSPVTEWLDRPWDVRYILFVSDQSMFTHHINYARKSNAQALAHHERYYLDAAALLRPRRFFGMPALATALIVFDSTGAVRQGDIGPQNWIGKRNQLDKIVLVGSAASKSAPYYLVDWDQGIPGDVRFSPAICYSWDGERYLDGWDTSHFGGNFGCREWTAQLYDRDQPYIDVTSYSSSGALIGDFVGWSRMADPPKPVIGLHNKTWFCLHDCPAGEKAGVIRDIKAWTKKHGFPMPTRPRKQPLYPNADYADELKELSD